MARKTFISYKYSEARDLRDRIIQALGDDATFYQGETSDSPDLTDTTTENIKRHLSDMMYNTSVTIVILSPEMKKSKWIPWEIEYSLKKTSRKGRTSHTNGVIGVIKKVNESYSWLKSTVKNCHNENTSSYSVLLSVAGTLLISLLTSSFGSLGKISAEIVTLIAWIILIVCAVLGFIFLGIAAQRKMSYDTAARDKAISEIFEGHCFSEK